MVISSQQDQIIDGYKIQKRFGEDQYRKFYSAYEVETGRQVSLSILKHEYASDSVFAQEFLRRGHSLTQIRHPNLLNYEHVGLIDETRPYIVTEYVDGFPLSERIERLIQEEGTAHSNYALTLVHQVASGLELVERLGLFHHDLTPEHILLRAVTVKDENAVIITDLDIPIRYSNENASDDDGSDHYLSPEQQAGRKIDGRSHVYSLGVILYELLSSNRFAQAVSLRQKLTAALRPGSTLAQFRPGLTNETYALVERATTASPRRRYPSLAAFQNELQIALEAEETRIHTDTGSVAIPQRPSRTILIPLLLLIICGVLGFTMLRPLMGKQPETTPGLAGDPAQVLAASVSTETPNSPATPTEALRPTEQPTRQTVATQEENSPAAENQPQATNTPSPTHTATVEPSPTATATTTPSVTPSPSATPRPLLRLAVNSANLRLGPGNHYDSSGYVYRDDNLQVIARSDNEHIWFNVLTEDGQSGWLASSVTELVTELDYSAIEIAATYPPSPTPTQTPTPTNTPVPPTETPSSGGGSSGGGNGGGGSENPKATPTPPF